jgi:hypothetical protein
VAKSLVLQPGLDSLATMQAPGCSCAAGANAVLMPGNAQGVSAGAVSTAAVHMQGRYM